MKKFFYILMVLAVLIFNSYHVSALNNEVNENTASGVLTYDEAVKMALDRSNILKNSRESIRRAEKLRNEAESNLQFIPIGQGSGENHNQVKTAMLNLNQADFAVRSARKQAEQIEERIAYQVRTAYNEVLMKTNEVELQDLAVQYAENKFKIDRIKLEHGIESRFNVRLAQNNLNEEKQKRENAEKELKSAYIKLNQLIGYDKDKQYPVLNDLQVKFIDSDINIDSHITGIINQHPTVWILEQQTKLAQQGVDLHTFNVKDLPIAVKEIDVIKAEYDLALFKENLKEMTALRYNQLRQLEDQYKMLQINLDKAEAALDLLRVKYDIGMVIKLDLQKSELTAAQLKNQMEHIIVSYEQLKQLFEKPWLM